MNSSVTSRFWQEYVKLPPEIRRKARKAFQLWKGNPRHPSLRFERKGDYWSVRVGHGWRLGARARAPAALIGLGGANESQMRSFFDPLREAVY